MSAPAKTDAAETPLPDDMAKLVERLETQAYFLVSRAVEGNSSDSILLREAADLITAQARQIAELLEALRTIDRHVSHAILGDWSIALGEIRKTARAAIAKATGAA